MKTYKLFLSALFGLILEISVTQAQNTFPATGKVGIGTTAPNASSLLEIKSTTKGLLIPRMTKIQRNLIASPATGLLVYQTDNAPGFYYYSGVAWIAVSPVANGANKYLSNLTAPTAINADLLPDSDNIFSIGSASFRYKNVYLYKLKFADGSIQTTAFTPYTAGNGISISGSTISNSAPDKVVTLTGTGTTTVTGAYPNFIINSTGGTGNGNAWNLTGNSGTDASTNFIGTLDSVPLTIKLNNKMAGHIDCDYLQANTSLGYKALSANTQGTDNVAIGYQSLLQNTTGLGNTSLGNYTLYSTTTGAENTASGFYSMFNNATGSGNTSSGFNSLYANSTGNANTASGTQSLTDNTTGSWNVGIGGYALTQNQTGNYNTALGSISLQYNRTGYSNVAVGASAMNRNMAGNNLVAIGDSALYNANGSLYVTAIGSKSLYSNTTGSGNTGVGYNSLFTNTTGVANTAVGTQALYANVQGGSNTATGEAAMIKNTSGSHNTATGTYALQGNISGNYNTATGDDAMNQNTTGSYNTASGINALYNNTTGNNNTAFGAYALELGSTGYGNVAIGFKTLYNGSSVHNMVAIGDSALFTQSVADVSSGELRVPAINIAVGTKALYSNSTGYQNTAIGHLALYSSTTSANNTAVGFQVLYSNTTGGGNTAIGQAALFNNTTGINNTAVGNAAGTSAANLSNTTALGNGATTTANNQVRVGNASVTSIGGQVGWSNLSDARIKNNIKENVPGLAFINLLRPVTYHFNMAKENELLGIKNTDEKNNADIEKINFTGFLAQEVDKAAQKINYDFSGVDKSGSLMGLRYSDFVVPLVKAVQELSKMNNSKDSAMADMQSEIENLKSEMQQLKAMMVSGQSTPVPSNTGVYNQQSVVLSSASLSQNIPNPFSNTTTINYSLPKTYSSAQIIIRDQNGKTLKEININTPGKGNVKVDASTLASGAYQYSLYVNGKLIDTKQMVSAR
ncbi:MAG TPA: tail fiber domain-containing protein [Parafilimonas sp.]|nr:tail fiber domain-containing protein [Parafilimonas sp.]